jgi:hypothetical protein
MAYRSAWAISDASQRVRQHCFKLHAQPCMSVQLCVQGLGDAACLSARVLLQLYSVLCMHNKQLNTSYTCKAASSKCGALDDHSGHHHDQCRITVMLHNFIKHSDPECSSPTRTPGA